MRGSACENAACSSRTATCTWSRWLADWASRMTAAGRAWASPDTTGWTRPRNSSMPLVRCNPRGLQRRRGLPGLRPSVLAPCVDVLQAMNASGPGSGLLSGKVCLVTGAGSGIGRATASVMTDEGGVVLGCDLAPEPGTRYSCRTMDVRDEQGWSPVDLGDRGGARPCRRAREQRRPGRELPAPA